MRYCILVSLLWYSISTCAAQPYPMLRDSRGSELQKELTKTIAELGLSKAVADKRLAITLVDLAKPEKPRMAGVNGDVMFYSASLPKIAILLGAYQRLEDKQLKMTPDLQTDLQDMIRSSSNSAATRVLDRVGRDYLTNLLMSRRYALYDPNFNGGLWVGKPYGPELAYKRDPLHNISHGATSMQVARFYYLMETGQLVSESASAKMRKVMGEPAIRHKFVKGLAERFPDAKIFRKSGTWRDYHSDSAIVEHDGKHYIIVALSHDPQGSKWLERLAPALDRLVIPAPVTKPATRFQRQSALDTASPNGEPAVSTNRPQT